MQYEVNKNKTLIAIVNTLSVNPDEQNPLILKNLKLLIDNLIILVKDKYSEYEDILENDQSEKTNFDLTDDEKSKVEVIFIRLYNFFREKIMMKMIFCMTNLKLMIVIVTGIN